MANRWGKKWKEWLILFSWASKLLQKVTAVINLRHFLLGRKVITTLDSILKNKDITLLTKVCTVKAMVFPATMYGRLRVVPRREVSTKNWCLQTEVLKKTFESPLDCKEVKPVNPKGDQSWIFIGRTDAKAEAPKLCPSDAKNQRIGKDRDAGKDWRQKEKRVAEDEMVQ